MAWLVIPFVLAREAILEPRIPSELNYTLNYY